MGIKYEYKITAFTPTFNRVSTLERVFKCLEGQTFKNFEWLIVDDGSTDNTKEIVNQFIEKAKFPIKYIYKENGGKHTAINLGVIEARGELFLICDSDDTFLFNAMETFYNYYISYEGRENISGVSCLCVDSDTGEIIGDKYPVHNKIYSQLDLYFIKKIRGEKWGIIRTDVMREFPFPEVKGMKFVTENIVWLAISRKYKTLYINIPLRNYYIGTQNSLASGTSLYKHPIGYYLMSSYYVNDMTGYLRYDIKMFIREYVTMIVAGIVLKKTFIQITMDARNMFNKSIITLLYPAALVYYKLKIRKIK